MRSLSGIQPSGALHIGNYFGAIRQQVAFQEEHECFYFIANYHALTSVQDPMLLREESFNIAAAYLALGLDPAKTALYMQSDLPEVTELAWYLSIVTPMGLLERCHSYKDKLAKGLPASHGLFAYPVLMAADILLPGADIVPVGKDQKQHVEVTRDIALKFNHQFGEVFTIPEPVIQAETMVVPGIDGQKMSKSYQNTIPLFAEEKQIKKAIMAITTDSKTVEEPKDPETCVIFAISRLFLNKTEEQALREKYLAGNVGYGDLKKELLATVLDYFAPARAKYVELSQNPDYVHQVLEQGKMKVQKVALPMIEKVRKLVGIV